MSKWKKYRKKEVAEMRPYLQGEDLTNILVSKRVDVRGGGMIARDPDDPEDQWFISIEFFRKNFEPAE